VRQRTRERNVGGPRTKQGGFGSLKKKSNAQSMWKANSIEQRAAKSRATAQKKDRKEKNAPQKSGNEASSRGGKHSRVLNPPSTASWSNQKQKKGRSGGNTPQNNSRKRGGTTCRQKLTQKTKIARERRKQYPFSRVYVKRTKGQGGVKRSAKREMLRSKN